MDVEITKTDGQIVRFSDINVVVRDFRVSSAEIRSIYNDVEGRHGSIDAGATFGKRSIVVPFYFKSADYHSYALNRDDLFRLVSDTEPFYVREMRRHIYQSGDNKYVGGKRYKVRLSSEFDVEQMFKYGFGEILFETTDLPFAESIGTTADIQRNGINAGDGLWGFGMGLEAVDDALKYSHTSTTGEIFRIFNAGDVSIHPFDQELKITISNVEGSTERFQITNHTNGSRSRINVPLKSTDKVIYDGPKVTRNGLEFLRDTRKDFIELSPGWNEFEIYYCDSATIEFDFRFYYK